MQGAMQQMAPVGLGKRPGGLGGDLQELTEGRPVQGG